MLLYVGYITSSVLMILIMIQLFHQYNINKIRRLILINNDIIVDYLNTRLEYYSQITNMETQKKITAIVQEMIIYINSTIILPKILKNKNYTEYIDRCAMNIIVENIQNIMIKLDTTNTIEEFVKENEKYIIPPEVFFKE